MIKGIYDKLNWRTKYLWEDLLKIEATKKSVVNYDLLIETCGWLMDNSYDTILQDLINNGYIEKIEDKHLLDEVYGKMWGYCSENLAFSSMVDNLIEFIEGK